MGIFICAFTSSGKTTLSKKYSNIIDMESTRYKYLNSKSSEQEKSTNRTLNPLCPNNYFLELETVKEKYEYILVSDEIVFDWFRKNNYKYWQIYPNENLLEEYCARCKNRGNNELIIKYLRSNWKTWINDCKNDTFASKKIELQTGEYLEDVLPNLQDK